MSPPGKPSKPTLTSSKTPATDGDHVTLTCTSRTSGVNKFQFFKDGRSQGNAGTSKTLDLKPVTFSTSASYTCKVYIDTVASDPSDGLALKGIIKIYK